MALLTATSDQVGLWHNLTKVTCGGVCRVLSGVMFQKDVVAPGRMRRKIHNPRILLLDCPLEYKKGENQTNVEIEKEEDWSVTRCYGKSSRFCFTFSAYQPFLISSMRSKYISHGPLAKEDPEGRALLLLQMDIVCAEM